MPVWMDRAHGRCGMAWLVDAFRGIPFPHVAAKFAGHGARFLYASALLLTGHASYSAEPK
jgi:hypothetical protein